jgi:hypothetical protein
VRRSRGQQVWMVVVKILGWGETAEGMVGAEGVVDALPS